ncbi:ABC transporter substrate-binding protein [Actinoplanes siamensis]|uniref:Sugar ABC transporter substrate-binding protein n=1 Tax=Actinoplanes siamensis TaxID=1223317 RepID=A0A919N4A2_9ACTN|nr:extracellular solute-binding protein [Actinoplanes siamensis]GIF04121.1 sugar ABC transporter substrate-binding protein [Actinoplanes siamensis]
MTAPRLFRGLMAAAIALPLALLGACGGDDDSSNSGKTELTFFWWGGEARAKLTEQALALYTQKHPGVTFKTTWQANQGYFDKLATLTAGDGAPDIFQIDDNYLAEYATRNVTEDLTKYQDSGKLDVTKFPESLWKYGVVGDKLAGLAMGENTQGLVFNKTKLEAAGQELPKTGMSWADFITWAQRAGAATGTAGTMDPSADYKAFWVWLRQNGKDFYTGNQLGFAKEDVQKWFELWKGARDAKATPTADVIHEGNATDITKQLVVTGKALTSWVWANQMPDIQKNTKDELGVVAYPGDPSAQWARASMYLSVYRGSKHKDAAVDVLNFLANDPEAGKILGTDRGLPSNLDIRTSVASSTSDPSMKASIALEDELVSKFGPAPTVPPKGHATVKTELIKAAEAAQFGTADPAKAAEQFRTAAQAAISR